MQTITTPTGIFVDAGARSTLFDYYEIDDDKLLGHADIHTETICLLPPNSYLPPIAVKDMSEEQVAECVEVDTGTLGGKLYKNYQKGIYRCATAYHSMLSLLRHSSLNPSTTFYIQIKK